MEQEGKLSPETSLPNLADGTASPDPGGPVESQIQQGTGLPDGGSEEVQSGVTEGAEGSASEAPQHAAIKKPIFIGSVEPTIVRFIEHFLFTHPAHINFEFGVAEGHESPWPLNKDEYTLMVLDGNMFEKLNSQYLFTQLGEEEQGRQTRVQQTGELRQHSLMVALQTQERIKAYRTRMGTAANRDWYKAHPKDLYRVNFKELKVILRQTQAHVKGHKKEEVTAQAVWNVMDLMLIYGHMVPVSEHAQREKVIYEIVINGRERLTLIRQQFVEKEQMIYQKQEELEQMKERIAELEKEIEASESQGEEPASHNGEDECDCEVCQDQRLNGDLYAERDKYVEEHEEANNTQTETAETADVDNLPSGLESGDEVAAD